MVNNNFEIKKVTGRAKVIRTGQVYTTYTDFAEASGYPDAAVEVGNDSKSIKSSELGGSIVKLLAKGIHGDRSDNLYIVESFEGERFIFGGKGLEIIEINTIEMPEMTYVEIAEPFGEHVRDVIRKAYEEGFKQGKAKAKRESIEALRMGIDMSRIHAREILDGAKPVIDRARKTAQERRDGIVEQAKKDVEELKDEYDGLYVVSNPVSKFHPYVCSAEFIVNKDKRTVVALLRGKHSSKVRAKGIAKCAPNDCFNVHIGKAIALRRALGIEVPTEYLNAPQPSEIRVGDVVKHRGGTVNEVVKLTEYHMYYPDGYCNSIDLIERGYSKIIDDSREV